MNKFLILFFFLLVLVSARSTAQDAQETCVEVGKGHSSLYSGIMRLDSGPSVTVFAHTDDNGWKKLQQLHNSFPDYQNGFYQSVMTSLHVCMQVSTEVAGLQFSPQDIEY